MAITIYNGAGKVVRPPRTRMETTGSFFRDTYLEHDRMIKHTYNEKLKGHVASTVSGSARYQVAWSVLMKQYDSKFQLQPRAREMFVYAPAKENMATNFAYELWRLWIKGMKPGEQNFEVDAEFDFPKLENFLAAHPIEDVEYLDAWQSARKLNPDLLKTCGHPEDPIAFMSLDDSVRLFKLSDEIRDLGVTGT